jgi:hypothetical protein
MKKFYSLILLAISSPVFADSHATALAKFSLENSWWSGVTDAWWPIMSFVMGLVDGFNPCAMWTLFILIGFLLAMKNRKKQVWIGAVFIGSSAIIYLGALLAYFFGFKAITSNIANSSMDWIFLAIGIIAIITGFITIMNAKNKGVDCEVRDVDSKKAFSQKLQNILNREKFILVLIGVTILAFSVNAFELLCSIAIPTIYTASMLDLGLPLWKNLAGITIYDFAYILDDIVVFYLAMKTLSLKIFDQRMVQTANFVGGLLLLLLGAVLLFDSTLFIELFA